MAALVEELWTECVQVHASDKQRGLTPFQKSKVEMVAAEMWKQLHSTLEKDGIFVDVGGALEPNDEHLPGRVAALEEQLGNLVDDIIDIRREFPPRAAARIAEELKRGSAAAEAPTQVELPETQPVKAVNEAVLENFREGVLELSKLVAQVNKRTTETSTKGKRTQAVLLQHVSRQPTKLETVLLQEQERTAPSSRKRSSDDAHRGGSPSKASKAAQGGNVHSNSRGQ